jgi:hypothetical protein
VSMRPLGGSGVWLVLVVVWLVSCDSV